MKMSNLEEKSESVIAFGTKAVQTKGGGRTVSIRFVCMDGCEHGILLMPQQVRVLIDDLGDMLRDCEKMKHPDDDSPCCGKGNSAEAV